MQQLLAFHVPKLAYHLSDVSFPPELYAIPWIMTMFTRACANGDVHVGTLMAPLQPKQIFCPFPGYACCGISSSKVHNNVDNDYVLRVLEIRRLLTRRRRDCDGALRPAFSCARSPNVSHVLGSGPFDASARTAHERFVQRLHHAVFGPAGAPDRHALGSELC
jgi:hypothetical protein